MARVAIAVQTITRTGLEPAYAAAAAAADGNSFPNDGRTFLAVVNGATDVEVTLKIARTIDGQAAVNPTVTVPATETRMIGPFPPGIYNQTDGSVHVDCDDESNVTIAAIRL